MTNNIKSLTDYLEEKTNVLFEKYNAFVAFSQDQISESEKQNIKYVYRGGGIYHEAGKEQEFDLDYKIMIKEAIEQDLKENGKEVIIERELINYECYYVGDISDAVSRLKPYDITHDEIKAVFKKNQNKHCD